MARKRRSRERGPSQPLAVNSDQLLLEHVALPLERGELTLEEVPGRIRDMAPGAIGASTPRAKILRLTKAWGHRQKKLRARARRILNPPPPPRPLTLREMVDELTRTQRELARNPVFRAIRDQERQLAEVNRLTRLFRKPPGFE